jgi:hypothetical protein
MRMNSIHTKLSCLLSLLVILPVLGACTGGDDASSAELGEVREIDSPAPAGSGEPNLAVGPDGGVYLTWIERLAEGGHALRFAVLEGDRWTAPRTIATGDDWFVNWADFPSLAALPDGRLAAHWLQKSGAGTYAYDVRIALSADGGATWSAPLTPHRDGTQTEHGFASMWAAAGDSVGAVWLDGRRFTADGHDAANEMMLMHTRIAADGTAAAEHPLDERICDCCQTSVAMTSAGPLVVYRDRSPEEIRDIYVVRQVDGAWTAPQPVHADGWEIAACPVNGPFASAEGDRVVVAWFTAAQDQPRVNVAFSDDAGATFGSPVRVDGGAALGRVAAQLLPDGGALVSWLEGDGADGARIQVRRVASDGGLGTVRTVAESAGARASGFPRMARAGDRVVFAWTLPGETPQVRVGTAALEGGR